MSVSISYNIMDPLTALSLACNALQIIDFGATMIAKCKELYKHGALAENQEVESMARHLTNLTTDLELPESFSSAASVQQEDKGIWTLAQQCSETANELICEVQKLGIQGTHRKRDAVRKAMKETWNQNPIESIQRRLEQYQRTLNTLILINLRQHARKVSAEQSKAFKDLDRKVQTFINAVAGDQEPFAALKELIQNENASCKQHVMLEAEKLRVQVAFQDSYNNLLESLYFPDIHARQEGIEEAHKKTFGWIFEKPNDQLRPWHDFIHWLESGHGTYWISGKAGSGKSTLMNLISQHPRTNAALKVWSGTSEVLLLKIFFWNAGTELQKSSRGLLRSIIFQIMEKAPELMPILEKSIYATQQRTQHLPTWTERRLLATLQHLLRYGLRSYRLCIFVDGLDEFSSNQNELLEMMRDLRQYSNIKICLSSRPYRLFQDEFGSSAMLKLQDLTEPDIQKYTSDKLESAHRKTSQDLNSSLRFDKIASMIVRRAEGVFLWVKLAVRDQLEGIRNHDDANQMLERLNRLPDEIEGIYLHMLKRIDKVYWKEVACYFHYVLEFGGSRLFDIAVATHHRIDDIILSSSDVSLGDLCRHCRLTRERIAITCQGILEVLEVRETDPLHSIPRQPFLKSREKQNPTPEHHNDLMELQSYLDCSRVAFLHRTALDFFRENGQATKLLKERDSTNAHPLVLHVKALLARLVIFPLPADVQDVRAYIESIMSYASFAEQQIGHAQPVIVDLIERSLSLLGQGSWSHSRRPLDASKTDYVTYFNTHRDDVITDFLGFVASFGFGLYVTYIIDSQAEGRTGNRVDYLLNCVLYGLHYLFPHDQRVFFSPVSGHLKLIIALLERGVNPRVNFFESRRSAWSFFLYNLYDNCFDRPELSVGRHTEWGSTLQAFVASGANPNERLSLLTQISPTLFRNTADTVFVKDLRILYYEVRLHLSPLAILRLCFDRNLSFLIKLEDNLTASGASNYGTCAGVSVKVTDGTSQSYWLEPKLSEKQADDLVKVMERNPSRGVRYPGTLRHMKHLLEELDLPQLFKQVRQEEEEALRKRIIQEAVSGDDAVSTDHEDNSDEWSTESSDCSDAEAEELAQSSQSPSNPVAED